MKYCVKCGNELMDESVLCTRCGCMIGEELSVSPKKLETKKCGETPTIVVVFNFVFTILAIVSFVFLAMSVVMAYVRTSSYLDYNEYREEFYVNSHSYFYVEPSCAALAMVSSIASIGFAVTSFILTLVKRLGTSTLLSSIARWFLGGALLFVSILFMAY